MRVAWTAPAARGLEDIGDYIARENPGAARRTVRRIRARARTLAAHPYLGRPGRIADTRELVITSTPFIVVYRVRDDRLEILAVFHSARIWPDTF
jgi:toxin ParE1/3/4